MAFDPKQHHRRSIRLQGCDYSAAGLYFITLCVEGRICRFGRIADCEMQLNAVGRMVREAWEQIPAHYPGVGTDAFVVMPNHVHGIIILAGSNDDPAGPAPTGAPSLAGVVGRFKTMTAFRYGEGVRMAAWPRYRGRLWQRNYYEHVIRDEDALVQIRGYISENPARWHLDRENPDAETR